MRIFDPLWKFRCLKRERRLDFRAHMDQTSALDTVCERLLSMNNNKQEPLIVAFGAAVFFMAVKAAEHHRPRN